jgi:AraC-like DNA-binding protein
MMGAPEVIRGTQYSRRFAQEKWHRHHWAMLGCMETGFVGLRTTDQSMVVPSGIMFFMPAKDPHFEAAWGHAVTGGYIALPDERITSLPREMGAFQMSELLLLLCQKIAAWGPMDTQKETPEPKRLMLTVLDEWAVADKADPLAMPLPLQPALSWVATQIMEHPEDMQTIDHWATVAARSRRSCTKHCGEEPGVSWARWRQRVKLPQSLRRRSAGKPVTEVALELGYQETSTFMAIFRKQLGASPVRYMKREQAPHSLVSQRAEHQAKPPDEHAKKAVRAQ